MKKEFDFKDVGKRTPYSVPEGFFEDVTRRVRERVAEGDSAKARAGSDGEPQPSGYDCGGMAGECLPLHAGGGMDRDRAVLGRRRLLRRVVSVAVCAASLAVIGYLAFDRPQQTQSCIAECRAAGECTIEEVLARMSDEEVASVAAVASVEQMYDIF